MESDEDAKDDAGTGGEGVISDVPFEAVYAIGPKIGEGAYSTVFSCVHR